jgi:hypothetical protein
MQTNKATKSTDLLSNVEGHLTLGDEDFDRLAIDGYLRLERMKTGDAIHADRQTLMIRLHAGIDRLKDFYQDGGEEMLKDALIVVNGYRPQAKKDLRRINDEQAATVRDALVLVDELFSMSTLWERTLSYKYGEEKCLIGADQTEYVLMTVH